MTPEMKKLLDYIDGKQPEDDFTRELDDAVQSVRNSEIWRLSYMTLQMKYQEKIEQGRLEGSIITLHELGYSVSEIARKLNLEEEKVLEVLDSEE